MSDLSTFRQEKLQELYGIRESLRGQISNLSADLQNEIEQQAIVQEIRARYTDRQNALQGELNDAEHLVSVLSGNQAEA